MGIPPCAFYCTTQRFLMIWRGSNGAIGIQKKGGGYFLTIRIWPGRFLARPRYPNKQGGGYKGGLFPTPVMTALEDLHSFEGWTRLAEETKGASRSNKIIISCCTSYPC